ncbi:hypothetical protein F5882DRAFT_414799 [Hyaloscypha sp. PMI_1271]|nr:hypothetical protein F5882DRAFT_414799 [Hyaloscypha sp. PMI_1271]
MRLHLLVATLSFLLITIVYSSPIPINSYPQPQDQEIDDLLDSLPKRASSAATTRTKATTVTQSVNNWIEDLNTVNKFLNVALALPAGPALKAGASKALAFAQDEPVNFKLLKATPGINTAGLSAAATLEKVFGDVLDQLGNVVSQPLSLPVAINAVARINVDRLVVRAMKLEICGWNCMNLRGADARMCFQLQRRCGELLRSR